MGFLSFSPAFFKCLVRILRSLQIKQKPHFSPQWPFQLLFLTTFQASGQHPNSFWGTLIPGAQKARPTNAAISILPQHHLPISPLHPQSSLALREGAEQEPEHLSYQGKMPIHGSTLSFRFKPWALPCHSWHMIERLLGRNASHWATKGYLRNPVLQSSS